MAGLFTLLKKNWRVFRNLRRTLHEQSMFKLIFITAFALACLVGLWLLFYTGFDFLDRLGGVGLLLIFKLFSLFFLALGAMMLLSSIITSFTAIFSSEETAFLFLKPLHIDAIALYKFSEAALMASWAFFAILLPFVGAYAWQQQMSFAFMAATILYSIPFAVICCGGGMLICLVCARAAPRLGRRGAVIGIIVALFLAAWLARPLVGRVAQEDATLVLNRLLPALKVASHPLLPSWWVAEGSLALTRGDWYRGLMLLGVLVANAALVGWLVVMLGRLCLADAWLDLRARATRRVRRFTAIAGLDRWLAWLPRDIRAIVAKDTRVFFRDPGQWMQSAFFFGLLGLYFMNLRTLNYHVLPQEWRNMITFINVFSVSAVMCSFGSRFVYPQLSLEGHGFWVIGMSPVGMGRVLCAKWLGAFFGMLVVSAGLMGVSTWMLAVEPLTRGVALGIAAMMSLAVASLATGLGGIFIDLKQQNPSAIVSGFGGTLNLVLSLAYMVAAILPFGVLFHLRQTGKLAAAAFNRGLIGAAGWLLLITAVTAVVPLALARRSLAAREY